MRYLLDANAYIQAKNQYYGMDICPAYRDWLDQQFQCGVVASSHAQGGGLWGVLRSGFSWFPWQTMDAYSHDT